MPKCPWCGKEIIVTSRSVVKRVVKPFSDSRTKEKPKAEGKDKIEVVAPPKEKPKAKSKAKGKKK